MPTKKKSAPAPKKKSAPAKKKPTAKKAADEAGQRMRFVKPTKKGDVVVEGTLIRKLIYKGTEYFLVKQDSGVKKYMNAKFWEGEA